MPQMLLPMFPAGAIHINNLLAFVRQDERITYFNGMMPVFSHDEQDIPTFRMITAQFIAGGNARGVDVARAFGVPVLSVKRAVKRYHEQGVKGFYAPRGTRGPAVLTAVVMKQAQDFLDEGLTTAQVAARLKIKADTLSKAVRAGRLHAPSSKPKPAVVLTNKSERSLLDSEAPMGMGASNIDARVAASMGGLTAVLPQFQAVVDVPCGGVLFALPVLLALGLIEDSEQFSMPQGYYGVDSLLMLLAFMALAGKKSVESLRDCAPGEWGKLLGLDRIPEVRTLRAKIHLLAADGQPERWSAGLCRRWMEAAPEQAGILYVDGHVRIYHGQQTRLPRHYVARQRLCLRATTDYWVNAMDGQPFFRVNQAIDPGLIKVIEGEIVPRLEHDVPAQHSAESLAAQPLLHRFTLVFDREGYSPKFVKRMKARRIACLCYHKYPGEDWSAEEFIEQTVKLQSGERVQMKLAERGTYLSGVVWLREIRKLTDSGHQTALLSTDYVSDLKPTAAAMFARWSQENFFRYARERFALDQLADYRTEDIPDPVKAVNPARRELDRQIYSVTTKLKRVLAKFGAFNLEETSKPKEIDLVLARKAAAQAEIDLLQNELKTLKKQRKETASHMLFEELPEEQRFRQLSTHSQQLLDTIKMIAYRSETAMANTLCEKNLVRHDKARSLLQALFMTEADLLPDEQAGTLTVRLHHMANSTSDQAIRKLCDELNATETLFPRTRLRLILKLGASQNPGDQVF